MEAINRAGRIEISISYRRRRLALRRRLLYIQEGYKEAAMTETPVTPKTSRETIAAIVMIGLVSVICILACTAVMIAFILNAPW
jgi:hypothetical protein